VVDVVRRAELYQAFVEAFRARGIGIPAAAHEVKFSIGWAALGSSSLRGRAAIPICRLLPLAMASESSAPGPRRVA